MQVNDTYFIKIDRTMKTVIYFIALLLSIASKAQVNWKFSSKKVADNTYDIYLTASVDESWHIYSQFTPDGGPTPTTFIFKKNPLVVFDGAAKEDGKLKVKYEELFGVDIKYFKGNVIFTQRVKVKSNIKTNVTGELKYMACNEEKCLPPQTVNFSIKLL